MGTPKSAFKHPLDLTWTRRHVDQSVMRKFHNKKDRKCVLVVAVDLKGASSTWSQILAKKTKQLLSLLITGGENGFFCLV
eukprot:scaffold280377_cov12-Tisochrysis_lutea.AAC.1